jgi:hypothetical protein
MTTILYLTASNQFMVERWLREHRSASDVEVWCGNGVTPWAQELRARYPVITRLTEIPGGTPVECVPEVRGEVVFPAAPGSVRLRFIEGQYLPWIPPLYPDFRTLWRLGVRRVLLDTLGGTLPLEIPYLLDAFHHRYRGRRCFVAGNGPSLNDLDISPLRDELTFGSNRCYLGFEKWGFAFTHWAAVDRLQLEEYGPEYAEQLPAEVIKFFPFEYLPLLRMNNACPMNFSYDSRPPCRFSNQPDIVYLGHTVTHALLQIAAMMGCNPIILIGSDHRYNLSPHSAHKAPSAISRLKERIRGSAAYELWETYQEVRTRRREAFAPPSADKPGEKPAQPRLWAAADASRPTHFTEAYTGGGRKFVMPQPAKSEAAFEAAAAWAREHGIEILNATPGTALKSFPLVDYKQLF